MAKSEHFQMFHSPDYLPQTCALKSLDWWREIARLLDLFLVGLFSSRSLKMFHIGSLGNGTVVVVSKPGIHAPMIRAILEDG